MTSRKRVLIVDDDQHIRLGANCRLKSAGYETLEATNGRHGVAAAAEFHPDAILMDIHMPVMDGVSAMRQLRNSPETCDIPVIVLSASPCEEAAALDGGARYFIRKPYTAESLITAIDSVTGPTEIQSTSACAKQVLAPA